MSTAGPGDIFGKIFFTFCGPKGSTCCTVLSVWGFLMLVCLGAAMKLQAVALFEDIKITDVGKGEEGNVKHAYDNAAISCFIAAVVYLAFLVFSGVMMVVNIFRSRAVSKRSA